ncbi:MAG: hypothetical protein Kow0098_14210 [Ignavibacteriaceae bacterium]
MLVSVIVPSFNSVSFIHDTLSSLIKQTYQNIEIIVIDGGSTDGTIDIIKQFNDNIAYWISEKDSGQSNAINKGFKICKGEIAGWLCSDDILYPDSIEKVVNAFNKNEEIGIVYGDVDKIDEKGEIFRRIKFSELTTDYLLNIRQAVPQQGSFYRTNLLQKVGYLDESLHQVMDFDLFIKLLNCSKGVYLNEPLGQFRMHKTNKSTVQGDIRSALEGYKVRKKYGGKFFSRVTRKIIRRILRHYYHKLLKLLSSKSL